ncbi:hypothetical protein B0H14DRAFT_859671 [Mycena olivaceomarginata]|nr:hypothetical protein B0H14DRAFT_859671 [Mycena olivaceomarginata]
MAPARLSCLDPICARLVKRTSGDMIISGRVYVFGNDSLDVCATLCTFPPPLADVLLYVLPLAPTTPALAVGNPVRVRLRGRPPPNPQPRSSRPHPRSPAQWYFVVANRHPKPKETASIPALTSTSTADDRISSSPYAIQVYPRIRSSRTPPRPPPVHAARSLEPAPTSQSIASRRSSPRAAQPYLDSSAIPMRFPTTHTVFEEVHPPRAAAWWTWPRRWAPRDNTRAGGVWLGPIRPSIHPSIRPRVPSPESRVPSRAVFTLLEEGTPRALAERLPIPLLRRSGVCLDARRSTTLSRAGLSVELCRARGARLPQPVAGYC